MVPIGFVMGFAIDVSHWFDYSRNLQNRADAAALAGASAFGNICLNGRSPGDTATGAQSAIGKWSQLYSGAGVNEPAGNLPYKDSDVTTATKYDVGKLGYLNNTKADPLRLTLGSLDDYHLLLNASNYWDPDPSKSGANFTMQTPGTPATFCLSDPKYDATDVAPYDPAGPMLDVKLTQSQLPFFIPFTGLKPNIHAHARVALQGELSGDNIRPIAVRDSGFTPCMSVDFINADTNVVIATIPNANMTRTQPTPNDPTVFENSANPVDVPIPTGSNVYVQPFLNNCSGDGIRLNDSTHTGLLYINSHPATDPTVATGDPPKLTTGGVVLTTGSCAPDQYFAVATGNCADTINAHLLFSAKANKTFVFAVDHFYDPTTGTFQKSAPIALKADTGVGKDPTLWSGGLSIPDQSGMHQIEITWEQQDDAVNGVTCGNGAAGKPAPCKGSFGIQQQAFGACNGCDPPDESGPVALAQMRLPADPVGTSGRNSFAAGSTAHLVVTFKLTGLAAAQPGDPATVLRFPVSGSKQTGLIDCGQGNGASADYDVIVDGCGPSNPNFNPPLNPLFINTRSGDCSQPWPDTNHQDCVQTTPGTRRTQIPGAIVDRITNMGAACPTNFWTLSNNYDVQGGDPRALTMIITAPSDLALPPGSPQAWIPIRRFATFYITGWDSNIKPQCGDNEAFPAKGKKSQQNAAIWGHWINYVDVSGIGDGKACDPTKLGNCVAALTR
jgi:hypothetical protein